MCQKQGIATLVGLQVLLVDDTFLNRQLGQELLKQVSVIVDTASNGLEAIAAVQEKSYDVVLMDIRMPEMDGLAATKIIARKKRVKQTASDYCNDGKM